MGNSKPDQPQKTPLKDSIWWFFPGQVAGMRKPDPGAGELEQLEELGVDALISLLDDEENLEAYRTAGITSLWMPITGGQPPSENQMQVILEFVDSQLTQNKSVAIHCSSGRRRTGTVVFALALLRRLSLAEVEERLEELEEATFSLSDLRESQLKFLEQIEQGRGVSF